MDMLLSMMGCAQRFVIVPFTLHECLAQSLCDIVGILRTELCRSIWQQRRLCEWTFIANPAAHSYHFLSFRYASIPQGHKNIPNSMRHPIRLCDLWLMPQGDYRVC